ERVATSHNTTPLLPPAYPAARVLPSGLKATLRTSPSGTARGALTHWERVATSHNTTPLLPPAYPAARVLPSGLKATLRTSPSDTARGALTNWERMATSHSTTPPSPEGIEPNLTRNLLRAYPAARVLPSGLKATLRTSPADTARGALTNWERVATSHNTTPLLPPAY